MIVNMPYVWRAVVVALLAMFADASPVRAQLQPVRAGQQDMIRRAMFAEGKLWVISDAGQLFAIDERSKDQVEIALPEPAVDLWRQDGKVAVLTCKREACDNWTARQLMSGDWRPLFAIQQQEDYPIATSSIGAEAIILTTRRIVSRGDVGLKSVPLSETLDVRAAFGIATAYFADNSIFVGMNFGEWGGGLRKVDRVSGQVQTIERNETGELCDGPLNTDCDPVHGIAPIPWKSDCVAIAIGLMHMGIHGRLTQVCGGNVEPLHSTSAGRTDNKSGQSKDPFAKSEAFFGVLASGDKLIAVGTENNLYELTALAPPQTISMREPTKIGGFWVNFDSDDFVLVWTNFNRRLSVSGYAPILVPR